MLHIQKDHLTIHKHLVKMVVGSRDRVGRIEMLNFLKVTFESIFSHKKTFMQKKFFTKRNIFLAHVCKINLILQIVILGFLSGLL